MPFFIEIKSGIVVPKTKKSSTYSLDFNRRENWETPQNKKILAIFYYWLQNSAQVIKGGYSTLYDILPSIGGIIQLIYYIFYSINFVYNKYIIIQDTNRAFFRIYDMEDSENINNKHKFSRCVKSLREESQFLLGKTNKILTAIKERRDSIYIAKFNRQKHSLKLDAGNNQQKQIEENNKNNFSNSNDLIVNMQNNITIYSKNKNRRNTLKKQNEELLENSTFALELKDFINRKKKLIKIEPLNPDITSHFINFFYFILFLFKFRRKSDIFYILDSYRQKLLGEEHIFRSNIILYHLERYFNIQEIQKVDIMELYEKL
jgi:hypothetical protein